MPVPIASEAEVAAGKLKDANDRVLMTFRPIDLRRR